MFPPPWLYFCTEAIATIVHQHLHFWLSEPVLEGSIFTVVNGSIWLIMAACVKARQTLCPTSPLQQQQLYGFIHALCSPAKYKAFWASNVSLNIKKRQVMTPTWTSWWGKLFMWWFFCPSIPINLSCQIIFVWAEKHTFFFNVFLVMQWNWRVVFSTSN